MLSRMRTRRAQRKQREQELDRQYAAEERAQIDDPDELGAELDQAEGAAMLSPLLFGPFRSRLQRLTARKDPPEES